MYGCIEFTKLSYPLLISDNHNLFVASVVLIVDTVVLLFCIFKLSFFIGIDGGLSVTVEFVSVETESDDKSTL